MTQGVFIHGSRPPTKKYLKAAIDTINEGGDPYSVVIEATSLFGNEFDGSLAMALNCYGPCNLSTNPHDPEQPTEPHKHTGPFYLVGPDPRTSRKWYANLEYHPARTDKEPEGKWVLR